MWLARSIELTPGTGVIPLPLTKLAICNTVRASMPHTDSPNYLRGQVETYEPKGGYGYIRAEDEEGATSDLFLVHRKSLRDPTLVLQSGDRVIFTTKAVQNGTLATDVHPELDSRTEPLEITEMVLGEVIMVRPERHFGFIRIARRGDFFFHYSFLADLSVLPAVGDRVSCRPVNSDKGPQAQDVVIISLPNTVLRPARDLLAQAVLAREERRYPDADRLYRRALLEFPTEHVISSYAAFNKNRNSKEQALKIYQEGIRLFPHSTKILEEAGVLAASLERYDNAIKYLRSALQLCLGGDRAGEKGILTSLGYTYYRMGTPDSLRESVLFYEDAIRAYGGIERFTQLGRSGGPLHQHLLAHNLAKIRGHYRGNLVFNFLRNGGIDILEAEVFSGTVGADFIVRTDSVELIESYGLTGQLLIRCMFKSNITIADLESLDTRLGQLPDGVADDQVALLVVGSLPEPVQRALFSRIEDRGELRTAIVPIPQQEIENSAEPIGTLLAILDNWLFRRDLYALNSPVKGRRFFGRGKALADIRDAIHTSTPTGLFGLRKVGKTSLLQEAQIRSSENGDIVIYVDLLRVPTEISDARWLYWRMANLLNQRFSQLPLSNFQWRLGGKYSDYLDVPQDLPVGTAFDSDLSRVIHAIEKSSLTPAPKVVLLLDEVESLLPTRLGRGFKGFFDFFGYLRGVCQETKQFTMLVTAANASIGEIPQFDERDNPVFNFFREVYLQFFDTAECTEMIRTLGRGMGIRYHDDLVCNYIFELTGGHPFFTRQLCSFIAKQYSDRPLHVTHSMVEDVLDRYIDAVGEKDFAEIFARLTRDYPEERESCLKLSRNGGSLPINQLMQGSQKLHTSLRHLEGYQIITVRNQRASLTMELLNRWLHRTYATRS